MSDKKIIAYKLYPEDNSCRIEPCSKTRSWMENTGAVRCLPLVIANQHGWAIYPSDPIYAQWDGGVSIESLVVKSKCSAASSHFGHGILTFSTFHLFRLPEGYNLFISGPPNNPKKGITPLTGIYEADWSAYPFTMNWMFTEVDQTVVFERDEPFCFIFPIQRSLIESFDLEVKSINDNEALKQQYQEWSDSRSEFNKQHHNDYEWQKHYFKGIYFDGSKCPIDHKTKLNLK